MVHAGYAHTFDDLSGGIVSPDPFNLDDVAEVAISLLNPDLPFLTTALNRIYGSYFQSPGTSEAYNTKCLEEIGAGDYISAADLFQLPEVNAGDQQAWYSAYAFAYRACRQFGCAKISEFLRATNREMDRQAFVSTFERVFGESLSAFEGVPDFHKSARKL